MKQQNRRTHKWAFPLGVLLVALAVVGAVTLANMAVNGVRGIINNPAEKAQYEQFLAQIVAHDPDPFDSPKRVQENVAQLLDICFWSLLYTEDATPQDYPMDDDGNMVIPQADIAVRYKALFGIDPPSYVSVEGSDFDFAYDAEAKVYRVPIGGSFVIYVPQVTDIKKTGSSVELTVDYLAYENLSFDEKGRPTPPTAVKTMTITLLEQDDPETPWQVSSVLQPMGGEYVVSTTVLE